MLESSAIERVYSLLLRVARVEDCGDIPREPLSTLGCLSGWQQCCCCGRSFVAVGVVVVAV